MKRRQSERLANKKRKISSSSSDDDDDDFIVDDEESMTEDEEKESMTEDEEEEEQLIFITEDDMLEELKQTDRETYDKFIEVKNVIDDSIPEITTIINEDMSINNKARVVELYEVFKLTEPLTEEWLLMKDRLNMLIQVYKEEYNNKSTPLASITSFSAIALVRGYSHK